MHAKTRRDIIDKINKAGAEKEVACNMIDADQINNSIHYLLKAITLLQESVYRLYSYSTKPTE